MSEVISFIVPDDFFENNRPIEISMWMYRKAESIDGIYWKNKEAFSLKFLLKSLKEAPLGEFLKQFPIELLKQYLVEDMLGS